MILHNTLYSENYVYAVAIEPRATAKLCNVICVIEYCFFYGMQARPRNQETQTFWLAFPFFCHFLETACLFPGEGYITCFLCLHFTQAYNRAFRDWNSQLDIVSAESRKGELIFYSSGHL